MLDKKDIQQIGSVMDEKLDQKLKEYDVKLDQKLKENNKNLVTKNDLKTALEENNKNLVTKQDLLENNKKLVSKEDLVENNKNLVTKPDLKAAFEANNKTLLTQVAIEVGKVIEENITPVLDEHSMRFDAIDRRIGKLDHDLRDYMDKKFNDMKGDIIAVVKGDRERDTTFKEKMVEIVRRNKLADEPEIALLTELIR